MKIILFLLIIGVVTVQDSGMLNAALEIPTDQHRGDCLANGTDECPQEIRPPAYWDAWWVDDGVYSQPEIALTDRIERVKSGRYALKAFTFWRRQNMGLSQSFDVEPGTYRASVYFHSWYSNCSSSPFSPPLDYDCATILSGSHLQARIGLSPIQETDPFSKLIQWGPWQEQYGGPWLKLESPPVVTRGSLTVFTQTTTNHPLKHEDVYMDEFRLVRE